MKQKYQAALMTVGKFSNINDSVSEALTTNFPEFEIVRIDLGELLARKDPLIYLFYLKAYGMDILAGRKKRSASLICTPYCFNKVKKAVQHRLPQQNFVFIFQTQSLFDFSVPGVPHFVYTDHTHLANLKYPGFNRNQLNSQSWIDCEKQIYRNATVNFTMSSNISKSLLEDYQCRPDQVRCIYTGANITTDTNALLDDARYARKNILFVGVDWERKGGPVLAEAFKQVVSVYPDASLTIVGCYPDIDLPNCTATGKIPLQQVKKYFEQASVFCLPTTLEPFGIVFLEAMAHKLPIVATDIGAIPDFISEGQNGYTVKPFDVRQLSEKLIKLLGSPTQCRQFGEFGQKLFYERYNWAKTGERLRAAIEPFLSG